MDGGGVWGAIDSVLTQAEEGRGAVAGDPKSQAHLLVAIGHPDHGYWQLNQTHQAEVVKRLAALVPRARQHPHPERLIEELFRLCHGSSAQFEDLARACKVTHFNPRPLWPGEAIYPTAGWVGSFCTWCRESEVPLGFYFWAAVSAIGAACRHAWFIDRNIDTLRLNYYTFLIGEPATGKSAAMWAAHDVLSRANRQMHPWEPGQPLPDYEQKYPHQVRLLSEDVTPQALMVALQYQRDVVYEDPIRKIQLQTNIPSTGMMCLDELATFLGTESWAVSQKMAILNRLYGGQPFDYETKKDGLIHMEDVALSILSCSTPEWLKQAISPLMFTGGFLDRVLIVFREPIRGRFYPTPRPRDPVVANHLARWLLPFIRRVRAEEITAASDAYDWYEAWYKTYPEPESIQEPTVKRRANLLWKTAAILALSEDAKPLIRREHFEPAAQAIAYEDEHLRRFMGKIDEAPEMDHFDFIERTLFRKGAYGDGFILRSDLWNYLRSRKGLSPPAIRADPYLQSLVAEGRLERIETQQARGRKGMGYRLTEVAMADWRGRFRQTRDSDQEAKPVLQRGEDPSDT